MRLDVHVLAGTRVFVTKQMALFGEYKYNHTTVPADEFKANYNAHFIVFGVAFLNTLLRARVYGPSALDVDRHIVELGYSF